ncbi:unnamed protein product, partial [Ectocarpus sp. 4 AP-2014]
HRLAGKHRGRGGPRAHGGHPDVPLLLHPGVLRPFHAQASPWAGGRLRRGQDAPERHRQQQPAHATLSHAAGGQLR